MRRRNGFTLVELLVVVGIISLLIAMLLPALNAAMEAAKTVACASNMRQTAMAVHMYAQENKGQLPYAFNYGTNYNDPLHYYTFFSLIAPQLGLKFDPADPMASQWYDNSVLVCPSDNLPRNPAYIIYREGGRSSYSVNGYISDAYSETNPQYSVFGTNVGSRGTKKLSKIPRPTETLLLVENWGWEPSLGYSTGVWGYGGSSSAKVDRQNSSYGYTIGSGQGNIAVDAGKQGYHNRKDNRGVCNWAFADGHVEAMNWKQTIMPRNLWQVDPALQAQAYDPGAQYYLP